jgi:hypothetical protein
MMIDIRDGKYRLFWDGNCYCISEIRIGLSGKGEGEEVGTNKTYHTNLANAITELILHRKLPEKDISTFNGLLNELKNIKNEIGIMFDVHVD